jgi:hypothetical protein
MGPPHPGAPVLQGTGAGVVGIFQRPECLLGPLDRSATLSVVHDHPDELLGLELRSSDHEAIDRSGCLNVRRWGPHERIMTTVLCTGQTTRALILVLREDNRR